MADIRTLTVEGTTYNIKDATARADLSQIRENIETNTNDISALKSALENTNTDINNNKNSIIGGKTKVEETATDVLVCGKNPVSVLFDDSVPVSVQSRNRFNLSNATFTFSAYSGSNTLTKTENGIKVVNTQTSTTSYVYCRTTYIAEYDGTLYFSCRARCDGRSRESVRDLRARVSLNGTAQELLYGEGLLFENVDVTEGDEVVISFYTHAGTEQGNTVYYDEIMLAYGGLYEYEPYKADVANIQTVYKTKTVSNLQNNATWKSSTSDAGGGLYYCVTQDTPLSDMRVLPPSNNDVANITVTGALNVVSYNQTYRNTNGIAVSTTGNISIYKDGIGKNTLLTWLEENPITITYEINEQETITVKLDHAFVNGERIVFDSEEEVSYYVDQNDKNKKCVCFGDSITGMFGNHADYPAMINLTTDIDAINAGFSGCRWTDHSAERYVPFCMNRLADAIATGDYSLQDASSCIDPQSSDYSPLYAEHLANIKSTDFSKVDYITLFWGTNDFLSSVIVNSSDDPGTTDKQHTNVEDAVRYTIQTLLTAYPNLRIIVITPYWQTPSGYDSDTHPDSNGKYLLDFAEKISDVAANSYHLPVLHLYKTIGVNMIDKYYYQKDDAHPTERLKWIIAERIINQINLS